MDKKEAAKIARETALAAELARRRAKDEGKRRLKAEMAASIDTRRQELEEEVRQRRQAEALEREQRAAAEAALAEEMRARLKDGEEEKQQLAAKQRQEALDKAAVNKEAEQARLKEEKENRERQLAAQQLETKQKQEARDKAAVNKEAELSRLLAKQRVLAQEQEARLEAEKEKRDSERQRQIAEQQRIAQELNRQIEQLRIVRETHRTEEDTTESQGRADAVPASAPMETPQINQPPAAVDSAKTEIPANLDEAGDYVIRLNNVGIAVSAGLRLFLSRNPSIRLVLLSTSEDYIQLNIRLETEFPLITALSNEFQHCKVKRIGRIILIMKKDTDWGQISPAAPPIPLGVPNT